MGIFSFISLFVVVPTLLPQSMSTGEVMLTLGGASGVAGAASVSKKAEEVDEEPVALKMEAKKMEK